MDEQRKRLQEQVDVGQEATLFLRYLDENPYFLDLMAKLENDIADRIMGLAPADTLGFTILQAQRLALYEPLKRAQSDKYFGSVAQDELEGKNPQGGIL